MKVIATAGHVDHGKSALVERLTGRQPDRWAEERRRGLTIGLGFVWTTLPGGDELAFVDVPGHQRFVPTMLAGAGPVPAALFVVAADEGWMPQSAEHLEALNALGVRHGLLAVTRCDLADPEPARRAALDAVTGTCLDGMRSVAVSAVTGAGIDELVGELGRLVGTLPPADRAADVRLWVDRSFSIAGAGTVVTGTLAAGTLRVGDELQIASTGAPAPVRGLQSLERPRDSVEAAARVAVNLRGVEREQVRHGEALVAAGRWLSTEVIDAVVPVADSGDLRDELVLHIGSAAVPVRVRPLAAGTARLTLARPLPLRVADRALLRSPGRRKVVARVDVLDVRPPRFRRRGDAAARGRWLEELARGDQAEKAATVLADRGAMTGADLRAMGLPTDSPPVAGDWRVAPWRWQRWQEELAELARSWRHAHPLQQGVPAETARKQLGVPEGELLGALTAGTGLALADGVLREEEAATLPTGVQAAVDELTDELAERPFAAPDANRLAALGLGRRELAAACRVGALTRIADGIVLLPDAETVAVRRLATLPQPFTVSQARGVLETSRRVAVPLLETMDRHGLTERLADSSRRVRVHGTGGAG